MPHKRKRGAGGGHQSVYDESTRIHAKRPTRRARVADERNGVSRELTRLLNYTKGMKPPSGLDEGEDQLSRRFNGETAKYNTVSASGAGTDTAMSTLKIQPGERLAEYSARVDAALPVGGLVRKGKSAQIPGAKRHQTKLERRMQRMQNEWRMEDSKIKARREEAALELADQLDEALPGIEARSFMAGSKSKEEDPWAVIAKSRSKASEPSRGLRGVHDVVEAPPTLLSLAPKLKMPSQSLLRNGRK